MADSFVTLVGVDFQWVNLVRRCLTLLVLYFSDGFIEEIYEGGLDVIFNYGSRRRAQGLSWEVLLHILENIFELCIFLYVPLCVVMPFGGSKIEMESSTSKNTPSKINEAICVLFHLPPKSTGLFVFLSTFCRTFFSSLCFNSFFFFGLCAYFVPLF